MKALHDLYTGPVNLWVEDELTRQFLATVWRDAQIQVRVAESKRGVRFAIRANAQSERVVVGLVDRDFGSAEPSTEHTRVFVLRAHEIENLLLDFDVLATLAGGPSATDLRQAAERDARALVWWAACCGAIQDLRDKLGPTVPEHPGQDEIDSRQGAARYIFDSSELKGHRAAMDAFPNITSVEGLVQAREQRLSASLGDGTWVHVFPGKELLRRLRSAFPAIDGVVGRRSPSVRDLDLAKRIAREMARRGLVPQELAELRAELRSRAGL